MYVVMEDRGKQYKVRTGDEISVDVMDKPAGATVDFDRVLLLRSPSAGVVIGAPLVQGAKVEARVLGGSMGPKVLHFKMTPRTNSRRLKGHRQKYTRLVITKITQP